MGYLFDAKNSVTNLDRIPDFSRYPELRWLNKYYFVPVYVFLLLLFVAGEVGWLGANIGGWQAIFWGFFLSTVVLLHVTLCVNSICHMHGRYGGTRRFATNDASVNHAWIALLTLGEGWHNNHHRSPASARNGFAWWELDTTYLVLRVLEAVGVVRELRSIPLEVLEEGGLRPPGQSTF
jgi:stearoyl-CoA desaturase (delta-9 desaturase)